MNFDITVGGSHKAQVTVDLDGHGAFSGSIVSPDFGTGKILEGVQNGEILKGLVSLDGYSADFSATLEGNVIAGTLSRWWFSETFTGVQTA